LLSLAIEIALTLEYVIEGKNLMKNKKKSLRNSGAWVGVGTAIGVAVYAVSNEPTWIAVGVAIGAALSWRRPDSKKKA
jgi:hypothetical protein